MWSFQKAFRDIWRRKIRSGLTILGIFIGVSGIVAIVATARNLTEAQRYNFDNTNQADMLWWVWDNPPQLANVIQQIPNVSAVERRASYVTKMRADENWRDVVFYSFEDYSDIKVSKLDFVEGRPPLPGEVAFEYSTKDLIPGLKIGDEIIYRYGNNNQESRLTVSGFARSPANPSATILQYASAYVQETDIHRFLAISGFNEILVKLDSFTNRDDTRRRIEDVFRKRNLSFGTPVIRDPDYYVGKNELDALVLLLLAFSVVGLVISGFLVANTLSAIVAEQIGEIGTLKALGAGRWQVLRLYMMGALIYGTIGTVLGLIGGMLGGRALLSFLGAAMNFDVTQFFFQPAALILGVVVGLGVTLLSAFFPAWGGTVISVRQALDNYGIASSYGDNRLDRALARLRGLPPLIALSLRNLMRRKVRNIITWIVIALSCAAFLAAQSTSTSVDYTIAQFYRTYDMDGWMQFGTRLNNQFTASLMSVPGVEHAEAWARSSATVLAARTDVWGVPADTRIYRKEIVAGRWFNADENDVILVTTVLANAKNIKVGDALDLEIGRKRSRVTVIGLLNDNSRYLNSTALGKVFAPVDYLERIMGRQGQATHFPMIFAQHDPTTVENTFRELERRYQRFSPSSLPAYVDRSSAEQITQILRLLLYSMVIIIALIGALGIVNTLTLNILERRREIGVLRSLGGTNRRLIQIFLSESFFLGVLGFAAGVALGYPLAQLLIGVISNATFPIESIFGISTLAYTFGFAMLLTIGASLGPALGAARVKVSQTIRYG